LILQSEDREYLLRVSYIEIYNEVITDLFNPSNTNLKIHENVKVHFLFSSFDDFKQEIYVGGMKEEFVVNMEQVLALMAKGSANRRCAKTGANDHSSRSHSIFRMVGLVFLR
jgi:centromeric protein E